MILDICYLTSIVYGILQAQRVGFASILLRIARTVLTIVLASKTLYISNMSTDFNIYQKGGLFIVLAFVINWFLSTVSNQAGEEFKLIENGPVSQVVAALILLIALSVFCSFACNFLIENGLIAGEFLQSSFVWAWIEGLWEQVSCKFEYLRNLK